VTFAGWRGSYGNTVIVDHGRGETVTLYGHLSRMNVSVGDKVKQGQRIGAIGNSGRSTGPHLHFEIRLDGSPVNPIKVFEDQ
jgi:murein DD-endopeptidase MepM/ murein hydrolase activator NlpD